MTTEADDDTTRAFAVKAAAGMTGAVVGLTVAGPPGAMLGALATPYLERAYELVADRFAPRRKRYADETLIDAATAAGVTTEEGFAELINKFLVDEPHEELLARVLSIAQDSAMRGRGRALGRILANAANETGTKVDNELAVARVIADLDAAHVRVLRLRRLTPADLVDYANHFGVDPSTIRRWTHRRIVDADPGLAGAAWFALIILERNQLIMRVGETGDGQDFEFEIMPLGAYLLELLSTPDPALRTRNCQRAGRNNLPQRGLLRPFSIANTRRRRTDAGPYSHGVETEAHCAIWSSQQPCRQPLRHVARIRAVWRSPGQARADLSNGVAPRSTTN